MRKAVAYTRVSTEGQAKEDKFGLETQKEKILEYCKEKDIEIVKWYCDEAVGGADRNHPAFEQILAREGFDDDVDTVVVAKADRVSRNIDYYYGYKLKLQDAHLNLISAIEKWDSYQDTMAAMIYENFLVVMSAIERENIKIRTGGGRRTKAHLGGYSGGRAPYGYRVSDRQLVINEDEAEMVRVIFTLKDKGYTLQDIADYLNNQGYKTRNGKRFSSGHIFSIVNNRLVYEGYYKYGNMDYVKGIHEPILTPND